jgi:glutathione S-transferase
LCRCSRRLAELQPELRFHAVFDLDPAGIRIARLLEERAGVPLESTGMTPELFARARKRLPLNRWDEAQLEHYAGDAAALEPLRAAIAAAGAKVEQETIQQPLCKTRRQKKRVGGGSFEGPTVRPRGGVRAAMDIAAEDHRPTPDAATEGGTIRVWRIPFSTNVERVALALAHKGLEVAWVDVDPDDRSAVRALSGQSLVPVLEHGTRVVCDSTTILEYLEERYPHPPLYPTEEARRAEARLLIDWFNRVWKRPPNELEAELASERPDAARVQALVDQLESSRDLFESLLADRTYLLGDRFSAVDCAFFPFLKYGAIYDPADDEPFHRILIEHLRLDGSYPRLEAWIRRVDEQPRA